MVKKLSVAFVWHMHQPCYKDEKSGLYMMPWVRLHAVKDYLDMLLLTEEFPNIRQTFNLVPLLLDQIEDYAYNGAHDLHSKYTVMNYDDAVTKRGAWFPVRKIPFENIMANVPHDITNYLESAFGKSYMELPPESQREQHFCVELDFGIF